MTLKYQEYSVRDFGDSTNIPHMGHCGDNELSTRTVDSQHTQFLFKLHCSIFQKSLHKQSRSALQFRLLIQASLLYHR